MTKVKLAYEILSAFNFLGIETTEFSTRKQAAGSLEKLHEEVAKMLGA